MFTANLRTVVSLKNTYNHVQTKTHVDTHVISQTTIRLNSNIIYGADIDVYSLWTPVLRTELLLFNHILLVHSPHFTNMVHKF